MKVSRAGTVLVLAAVSASTYFLVSTVMSQTGAARATGSRGVQARRTSSDPKGNRATLVETSTSSRPAGAKRDPILPGPWIEEGAEVPSNLVTSTLMEAVQLTSDGRTVSVAAAARIVDRVPTVVYVWSLSASAVVDGKPQQVLDRYYREQVFRVPLGQICHFTLHEEIELPPGDYTVQVRLHRLPENFDLSKLGNRALEPARSRMAGMGRVHVSD